MKQPITQNINSYQAIHQAANTDTRTAKTLNEYSRLFPSNQSLRLFKQWVEKSLSLGADCLYIEPETDLIRVRFRTHGVLSEEIYFEERNTYDAKELLLAIDIPPPKTSFICGEKLLTTVTSSKTYTLRVLPLNTQNGIAITIEIHALDTVLPSLDTMAVPAFILRQVKELLQLSSGIFVIAGNIGNGKKQSLYAMLDYLNTPEKKIISLEDPVLHRFPRINQILTRDIDNASNAADYLLSQQASIYGLDTSVAPAMRTKILEAAVEKHAVITTQRARSAMEAIQQLIKTCDRHTLAYALNAVLLQHKLMKVCETCKKVHHLTPREQRWVQHHFPGEQITDGAYTKGEGCENCNFTGLGEASYIYELVIVNDEISRAVAANNIEQLSAAIALRNNFNTALQRAYALATKGVIPIDQVLALSSVLSNSTAGYSD